MHNKTRFWLITLEVALTLAIVVNCLNLMMDMRGKFSRPTGLDEENLIVLRTEPFSPEYEDEDFVNAVRERDLDRLHAIPGVRAATAITAIPLSGGGSSTVRKALGSDLEPESAPYFVVTPNALTTFGVELTEGRSFTPEDFLYERDENDIAINRNVILTKALAEKLFPEGNALGQVIQNREGQITNNIIGIIARMHNAWPDASGDRAESVMLLPGEPGSERRIRYMIRTEAGAIGSVFNEIEGPILDVEPNRIVTVETLAEIKDNTYGGSLALVKILGAVIVLLVLVTSIGIIGLTAFSVTERTRQIGTRRALGATKGAIARYFLVENWMITAIGLTIGGVLAFALNYGLIQIADAPKIDLSLLTTAVLALWTLGLLAALAPALRATNVLPEIATRNV
jgi:putative ABC transport system permease protein